MGCTVSPQSALSSQIQGITSSLTGTLYLATTTGNGNSRRDRFYQDLGVWKDAPVLTGTTKFEPLPDVKSIMVTGGAGFM